METHNQSENIKHIISHHDACQRDHLIATHKNRSLEATKKVNPSLSILLMASRDLIQGTWIQER